MSPEMLRYVRATSSWCQWWAWLFVSWQRQNTNSW